MIDRSLTRTGVRFERGLAINIFIANGGFGPGVPFPAEGNADGTNKRGSEFKENSDPRFYLCLPVALLIT